MNNIDISTMHVLDVAHLEAVTGGSALEDGKQFGGFFGMLYWGARDYLSETVYPYWLD